MIENNNVKKCFLFCIWTFGPLPHTGLAILMRIFLGSIRAGSSRLLLLLLLLFAKFSSSNVIFVIFDFKQRPCPAFCPRPLTQREHPRVGDKVSAARIWYMRTPTNGDQTITPPPPSRPPPSCKVVLPHRRKSQPAALYVGVRGFLPQFFHLSHRLRSVAALLTLLLFFFLSRNGCCCIISSQHFVFS